VEHFQIIILTKSRNPLDPISEGSNPRNLRRLWNVGRGNRSMNGRLSVSLALRRRGRPLRLLKRFRLRSPKAISLKYNPS
jgi:hypothetical protein